MRFNLSFATVMVAVLGLPALCSAVDLFTDDFDADHSANWTKNGDTNIDDPGSHIANFFFDYSAVGIPSAPHSTGGTTRGMKLQTNMDINNDGLSGVHGSADIPPGSGVTGMSVSPNGLDISAAGDFKITADVWGNYMTQAGASGTSNFFTAGFGTTGTFANFPGAADGLFFGGMVDGGSSADFRVYAKERQASYQVPWLTPGIAASQDPLGQPIDGHATYLASQRNNAIAATAFANADFNGNGVVDAADYTIWRDNVGLSTPVAPGPSRTFGNVDPLNFDATNDPTGPLVVEQRDYDEWKANFNGDKDLYTKVFPLVPASALPAAQKTIYDNAGVTPGDVPAGATGMAWHSLEIDKVGNLVTWLMDGTPLIKVDITNLKTPFSGGDILFGMSDINAGSSIDPNRFDLLFALFDNIKVTTIPPGSGAGGGGGVPEPSTFAMVLCGLAAIGVTRRLRGRA